MSDGVESDGDAALAGIGGDRGDGGSHGISGRSKDGNCESYQYSSLTEISFFFPLFMITFS